MLGIMGAGLFYGDAVLTPAISVLSAVEGLKLATPLLRPLRGADHPGDPDRPCSSCRAAAPAGSRPSSARVMLFWFATLALTGLLHIADDPSVVTAINPALRRDVLRQSFGRVAGGSRRGLSCRSPGAEALYADLGHFGGRPIRIGVALPRVSGAGPQLFRAGRARPADPDAAEIPFFRLVPDWALLPMVDPGDPRHHHREPGGDHRRVLVDAPGGSARPAAAPRNPLHLGAHQGQIYLPRVNMLLLVGVIILVLIFQSSSNLSTPTASSVFGAMSVDAVLAIMVIWKGWRWSLGLTLALMLPFLFIDLSFFGANLLKLFTGGYVPVILASVIILMMWTWVKGTTILFEKTRKIDVPFLELVRMLEKSPPHQVKGTAVFLTSDPDTAPAALLHNLKHNKVLHEKNVILTVRSEDVPRVEMEDRVRIEQVGAAFWRIQLSYGYMETPNIPRGLALLRKQGFKFDIMATSFFLSRRSIRPASHSGMPLWQDKLFIGLAKSASDATDFFQIPTGRVVEVGTQVTV